MPFLVFIVATRGIDDDLETSGTKDSDFACTEWLWLPGCVCAPSDCVGSVVLLVLRSLWFGLLLWLRVVACFGSVPTLPDDDCSGLTQRGAQFFPQWPRTVPKREGSASP